MGTLHWEELDYGMPAARPVSGEEYVHPRFVGGLSRLVLVCCGLWTGDSGVPSPSPPVPSVGTLMIPA